MVRRAGKLDLPVGFSAMQTLSIRDGVGFCQVGARTIILDIDADRYWQMDERAGEVFRKVSGRDAIEHGDPRLARLVRLGFLQWHDETRQAPSTRGLCALEPLPAAASALETDGERVKLRLGLLVEIGVLLMTMRCRVQFWSLHSNLKSRQSRQTRHFLGNDVPLAQLARIFHRYRRSLFFAPACLPDTLAFLRFAARRGHRVIIVFGVEAYPFAAHCWAQFGELILTDTIDQIRAFTPIYAL